MRNEFNTASDFFAAMQQLNQSALAVSAGTSSFSMGSNWPEFSFSVRQITNNKGETYPSDFGVGLPPLVSQDDY
ncbi:MAG: hypothetical protein EKK48_14150 [Candidatus Melainabacteria bacterium]|nr:MAG: hypothetical protein EKK48_14150 [Candidatus Melainabacteria bacterium]